MPGEGEQRCRPGFGPEGADDASLLTSFQDGSLLASPVESLADESESAEPWGSPHAPNAAAIDKPNSQRLSTRGSGWGSRRNDVMGWTLGAARGLRKVAPVVTCLDLKVPTATVS